MLLLFKGVYGNNLHVAYTHRFSPLHQIFIFIGTLTFTEYYWYSDSVPFLMVQSNPQYTCTIPRGKQYWTVLQYSAVLFTSW